uniref:Uncharacterized protein n=1 Tax=Sparus aurata TaxID=8175 RepID=A0A671VPQ8_SPAAU
VVYWKKLNLSFITFNSLCVSSLRPNLRPRFRLEA